MARHNRTSPSKSEIKSATPDDVVPYAEDLRSAVQDAIDYIETDVSPSREKGWRYFNGYVDKSPPEDTGRSLIVQTEVRDTIEQAMPVAMDMLLGTGKIVEFQSKYGGQDKLAELATEFCNCLFFDENDGETLLHDGLKDCFAVKNAVYRVAWEDQTLRERYTVKLARPELEAVAADDEITLHTVSEPDKQGIVTVDLERVREAGRLRVLTERPEALIVDPDADTVDNARVVGIRGQRHVSDVMAMGLDIKLATVLELAGPGDDGSNVESERQARTDTGDGSTSANMQSVPDEDTAPGSQQIEVVEVWIRFDADKDGTEELLYVVMLGAGRTVVHAEPAPWVPLVVGSVIRVPHQLIGTSYSDLTVDIQDWTTDLSRGLADNAKLVNNPRKAIVTDDVVSIAAIEANIYNGWIPVRSPDAITEFATPFVGDKLMAVLEYAESRREARTGISRRSLGLDADAMRSMSEIYVAAVLGAPTKQLGLAIRMFAATAVAPLFRLIMKTAKLNAPLLPDVRVGGELRQVDPRIFPDNLPLKVKVGLGIESREVKMQGLMTIAAEQKSTLGQMGPDNAAVSIPQYCHTMEQLVRTLGYSNAEMFFNPPQVAAQMEEQRKQQPQQGDPEKEAKAQAAMMTAQAKIAEGQAKLQMQQQKQQGDMAMKQRELQMEYEAKQKELAQDFQLAMLELAAEAEADREARQMDTAVALRGQELDAEVSERVGLEQARHQGDAGMVKAKGLSEAAMIKAKQRPASGKGNTQLRKPH